MTRNQTRRCVSVKPETWQRLKQYATENNLSMSSIVEGLVKRTMDGKGNDNGNAR